MRKIFLYFLAAFILTSCDNLKKKDKSDSDDEEVTTKKKKKPLEEDTDEEETPKKKKSLTTTDEEETPLTNKDDENESNDTRTTNYSKGWSTTEKNTFMSTCVEKASTGMGQARAENYCSCMLDKIQELYPNSNDAGKLTEQKTTQLAKECLGQ